MRPRTKFVFIFHLCSSDNILVLHNRLNRFNLSKQKIIEKPDDLLCFPHNIKTDFLAKRKQFPHPTSRLDYGHFESFLRKLALLDQHRMLHPADMIPAESSSLIKHEPPLLQRDWGWPYVNPFRHWYKNGYIIQRYITATSIVSISHQRHDVEQTQAFEQTTILPKNWIPPKYLSLDSIRLLSYSVAPCVKQPPFAWLKKFSISNLMLLQPNKQKFLVFSNENIKVFSAGRFLLIWIISGFRKKEESAAEKVKSRRFFAHISPSQDLQFFSFVYNLSCFFSSTGLQSHICRFSRLFYLSIISQKTDKTDFFCNTRARVDSYKNDENAPFHRF